MRKLLWFTLGFGAACVFGAARLPGGQFVMSGVFLLAGALVTGFAGRGKRIALAAAFAAAGLGCGLLWYSGYQNAYLKPAMALDGKTQTGVVRISDYAFDTGYAMAADGILEAEGRNYRVRVYLEDAEAPAPGTLLEGEFRFRITFPGGKQEATSHAGNGIFLLAYQQKELERTLASEQSFPEKTARIRLMLKQALDSALAEDARPFARALLLGDTSLLSYETDTHLKVSGIRHVAAVSGLHVSILFALAMNLAFHRRFLSAVFGFPVLFLFAAVTGFTPSVNRACIMSGLMLLALVVKREYDPLSALSTAVLVMLLINPLVITSVSFQLSAASVAGILLFSEPASGWLREQLGDMNGKSLRVRLKRWFSSSVATSVSAMVLTVPLSAWYFGTVSLVGVVTNLLTLWIISFIFYALMAVCALSFFHGGVAAAVGSVAAMGIRFVLLTAKLLSGIPVACVYTASPYVCAWLIFAYILLAIFSLGRQKKPGLLAVCGALGLCCALLCSWVEPMLYDTVVTVLDVGQGQSVLLQSQGRNYLVDCGGDSDAGASDAAAQLLLSRGISRLDGLILTHTDRDHAGGAANLLSRIPADLVILPPASIPGLPEEIPVICADRVVDLKWGSSAIRIFGEKSRISENENGLCILLDTEKCDILITGDRSRTGEARLLEQGQIPHADILVAGHHGSKDSTSEDLLAAVRPETVCISVGAGNIYGHPHRETLERLESFGCRVYRTDLHGTVTIRR